MRVSPASLQFILIGLIALAVAATTLASSQPASSSNAIVAVYPLLHIDAKAGAATVQALVKGCQAYAADPHTVVVITPDVQRQKTASEILSKLDRSPSTSQVQDVERLSTDVLPGVLKNVVTITRLRYPEVYVTEEDSSASLLFQGPYSTTMKAYCFAKDLIFETPGTTKKNARCFAKQKLDPVSQIANLIATTYTVNHAVPYGLPSPGTTATTTVLDMATAASAVLQSTYPDLKITQGPANNLIAIQGSARSVGLAKQLLGQLDKLPPQVELDVTIYGLEASKLSNIGFNLPTDEISTSLSEYFPPPPIVSGSSPAPAPIPALAFPGKPLRSPLSLLAQINLLNTEGIGRVLSRPMVITLSGRPATITAGENIPFFGFSPATTASAPSVVQVNSTTSSVQLGTTLTMLPIVNEGGNSITLYLNPSFSSFRQFTPQGLPETVARSAQTTINVPNGQAVVITGLNQLSESDADGYLPPLHGHWWLSDIFHQHSINKDQIEIVIVVKPTILTGIATKFATPPTPTPPPIPSLAPLITPTPSP